MSGPSQAASTPLSPAAGVLLGAYFVTIWGSGFVVTRIALSYAAPFTYIGVRREHRTLRPGSHEDAVVARRIDRRHPRAGSDSKLLRQRRSGISCARHPVRFNRHRGRASFATVAIVMKKNEPRDMFPPVSPSSRP